MTQRYCSKDCGRSSSSRNAARTRATLERVPRFVGVDGEGVTHQDGTHDYVLLSVGDRSLARDGSRLTWRDIFPFLYDCFTDDPAAVYVGFYLGYDFTQWLRTLPHERAIMLLTQAGIAARKRKTKTRSGRGNLAPFPVYLEDWEFDIHAGKRFKLRPHDGKEHPWMYICDAGPFYQTSFLTAINPSEWPEPIVTPEDYATIEAGKQARAGAILDDDMVHYNVTENRVMGTLMESLNSGFRRMGIRLSRQQWYGPGQAVAKWLDNIEAPTGETIRMVVPEGARDAARQTYFGGWFEIFAHGHIGGTAYEYDINSAYPHVIASLPCLLHGRWKHGFTSEPVSEPMGITMVHAELHGSNAYCGTALHRTPRGSVFRPLDTSGWYMASELKAAEHAGLIDTILIDEWWTYIPCDCPPPIRSITDLYEHRLRIGKKTPEGRAVRIVFNSCYGKFAQSVGEPKFANPVYASLITSGCRTLILKALASHPAGTRDLLMIATDGIYFRTRHPELELSETTLGLWDETVRENLTLIMPGIYWDDKTRERIDAGESPKLKSRGINAKDLAGVVRTMDIQFSGFEPGAEWPATEIPVTFDMVTATQALARGKWETAGVVHRGTTRQLTTDPKTKRSIFPELEDDGGMWRSFPFHDAGPSTPYDKRFGEELRMLKDAEGLTPDGDVWDILRGALT